MINIPEEKVIELHKRGYNLDILYYLERLKEGNIDLSLPKIENIYKQILRKSLYSESTGKITMDGEELLSFISSPQQEKIDKKMVISNDKFLEWWEKYPKSDSFTYKGRSFTGSRGIRVKKEECKSKINSILKEGEYTVEDLIRALEYEIHLKKEKSIKDNKNILSYLQNSLTYLNQRTYENFIETSKTVKIQEASISNETYI